MHVSNDEYNTFGQGSHSSWHAGQDLGVLTCIQGANMLRHKCTSQRTINTQLCTPKTMLLQSQMSTRLSIPCSTFHKPKFASTTDEHKTQSTHQKKSLLQFQISTGLNAPKWSSQTRTVPSSMPNASILPFSDTPLLVTPMGRSQPLEGVHLTN